MKDNLRDLLDKNRFIFNKRYGQNFISDTNLLEAIVSDSGVTENDTVVEIGAGAGTLTAILAKHAKKVISFEIDVGLEKILQETLKDCNNVVLQFADIMKVDSETLSELTGGEYKVVANLPYYITTPIVMRFIEDEPNVRSITVMVQEEVATRFQAKEGTKDYGAITPSIRLVGDVTVVRKVNRSMFYPQPNVDSAVVKIDVSDKGFRHLNETRRTIKAAFSMRRKTLLNCISEFFKIEKERARTIIEGAGFLPSVRGETLTPCDFDKLAEELIKGGLL